MSKPLVVIIMGSKADEAHCQQIADAARSLGLEVVTRVGSAHKTPEHVLAILREYEAQPRPKVYIAVAGRSNALAGFIDGAITAPVITCPPPSEAFGGGDIFSSLRMPTGIAPAVVLEPGNAALLAAKILGIGDAELRAHVVEYRKSQAERILKDDRALNQTAAEQ